MYSYNATWLCLPVIEGRGLGVNVSVMPSRAEKDPIYIQHFNLSTTQLHTTSLARLLRLS